MSYAIQLNLILLVLVEDGDFKLDPKGHSADLWATEEMLLELKVSEEMEKIVESAFEGMKGGARVV